MKRTASSLRNGLKIGPAEQTWLLSAGKLLDPAGEPVAVRQIKRKMAFCCLSLDKRNCPVISKTMV